MKLGAQLYTLRDYMKTPEDIEKSLNKVREIGYKSVQVSGIGDIEPEKLRNICDGLGIEICSTHISYDDLLNQPEKVIEKHKIYGCTYVGLGALPGEFRNSKSAIDEGIASLKKISENLKAGGMKFMYHNHDFEFVKHDDQNLMERLVNELDCDFILDTFWVQAAGADPVVWINKLKDRIKVIHYKDMAMSTEGRIMAAVGEGNMNWDAIIDASKKTGVEYVCVEQDVCPRDPFDCLKSSYEFLKNII